MLEHVLGEHVVEAAVGERKRLEHVEVDDRRATVSDVAVQPIWEDVLACAEVKLADRVHPDVLVDQRSVDALPVPDAVTLGRAVE